MNTWFSSDAHHGHFNVISYCNRPFKTVEEMDGFLVNQWQETVKPDDIIYYLGDFSLKFNITQQLLPTLHGKIHYITGNHDSFHIMHKKHMQSRKWMTECKNILSVQEELYINIAGRSVLLSHFPYRNTEAPGATGHHLKYMEWRPENRGGHSLCGHVHERFQQQGKQINVSWDAWHKILSLAEIEEMICNS